MMEKERLGGRARDQEGEGDQEEEGDQEVFLNCLTPGFLDGSTPLQEFHSTLANTPLGKGLIFGFSRFSFF